MRDLYHGSTYDIQLIDLEKGKGYKDFGKGFYATAEKRHADSIARRNKRILQVREERLQKNKAGYKSRQYVAYRYNLEFDDRCLDMPGDLKVKIFRTADKDWLLFVLKNRDSEISAHDYDVVIGPTADENTVTVINSYKEELEKTNYSDDVLEALIKDLQPENLPKQYFFGTPAAIQLLHFKTIRREIVG